MEKMRGRHIGLAVFFEYDILPENVAVPADYGLSVRIPDNQLLIGFLHEIVLVEIHRLARTPAGFTIGDFADAAYFPQGIGCIETIYDIDFITTLVGVHQLARWYELSPDKIHGNGIDDLFHLDKGSVQYNAQIYK